MSKDSSDTSTQRPGQGIGSRRRQRYESTYGFPNHADGIQSGNLTGEDATTPVAPLEGNTPLSGPGDTHSNGMKGQG